MLARIFVGVYVGKPADEGKVAQAVAAGMSPSIQPLHNSNPQLILFLLFARQLHADGVVHAQLEQTDGEQTDGAICNMQPHQPAVFTECAGFFEPSRGVAFGSKCTYQDERCVCV